MYIAERYTAARRLSLLGLALFAAMALSGGEAARAESLGWPLSSAAEVITAFGTSYTGADGTGATHRGVDLAAQQGDLVLAPCSGVVRFVGRVPATGVSGTQLAVTIERADCVRFTLMPLEAARVVSGERVESGSSIAQVAGAGDASSSRIHLHLGARRGDLYLDPCAFVAPPVSPSRPEPQVEPARASEPRTAPSADVPAATAAATPLEPASDPAPDPAPRAHVAETSPLERVTVEPTAESARLEPDASGSDPVAPVQPIPFAFRSLDLGSSSMSAARAGGASSVGARVRASAADVPLTAAAVAMEGLVAPAQRAVGTSAVRLRQQQGSGVVRAAPAPASAASGATDLLAAAARRSLPEVRVALSRLGRAWLVALAGMLTAAGALWPLWRRQESDEEPGCCVAPVGSDVAAAAGR